MEITVNIPKNDYVQPTEVRQEVVQAICEAFIRGGYYSVLHPISDRRGRCRTLYVELRKGKGFGFAGSPDSVCRRLYGSEYLKFNGAEVNTAFQALIKAGYHIFQVYSYGTWMGYVCDVKPYRENGTEVYEFTDFID